jgi:DNA repair protein SbcC/Rad50
MRILGLRFKNLNSLYGEWGIDFTRPEYVYDGIFTITGPTGAGKSTILDAMCLALYARTPRLKTISKTTNEIMSRQTGECFAEVSFETKAGAFCCHWSQQKAHRKVDGNLTDSKHEISDAKTGKVLASKKRDVAVRVEQETGMDFDRFTRSMLLAQGGFSAFLSAAPDKRAPILEQITGTNIYSEISKKVHERRSDEHNQLELLEAQTAGIPILSDEEETAFNLELKGKLKIEQELRQKNDGFEKFIQWLTGIDALKVELAEIDKESTSLAIDLKAFEPDREKLQDALKATELESDYATLVSKREQQRLDLKALADSQALVPDQEKILALKQTDFDRAQAAVISCKARQRSELEPIKKVRALDLHIAQKSSVLKTARSDYKKIQTRVFKKKDQCQKAISDQKRIGKKLGAVEDYLSANSCDANLVTQLTGINEQIKNLEISRTNILAIKAGIAKFKKQLAADTALHDSQGASCNKFKKKHEAAGKLVSQKGRAIADLLQGRLLREYRTEHDSLLREMVYLRKIASLEDERRKLEDDKPCPLCGALVHPFARGNVPPVDKKEERINKLSRLIKKAENLENDLKKGESKEKTAALAMAEAEKQLVLALHKKNESLANVQRSEKELQAVKQKSEELNNKLGSSLEKFSITKIPDTSLDSLSEFLNTRQKSWLDHERLKSEIQKDKGELLSMIKSLDAILKTLNDSLQEKQALLEIHQRDFERLGCERKELYGSKNPDKEEIRLENLVLEAEKAQKVARKSRDKMDRQLNELNTRIRALKENTAKRKPELEKMEFSFDTICKKAGFKDEQSFILCRLSFDERSRLNQRARALDNKQTNISTRKKDRKTRLGRETARNMTNVSLDVLKNEQAQTREAMKVLGEQVGAIKQKLSDNTRAKIRLSGQIELIDAQKKECTRWDGLHSLIGSADGKKYRNFAQGLTFEVMVSHANRQLEKMSDRYLLVRDEKFPLELNIVDDYQAGEIRSTKNLSGGESFIVSLSLALGLSHMASRNVRVDSLFLDEGFGTLDDEALEISLEALAGLHQKGKLIGVISHVSALKERISTQIDIVPASGGKSSLEGPGCRRID